MQASRTAHRCAEFSSHSVAAAVGEGGRCNQDIEVCYRVVQGGANSGNNDYNTPAGCCTWDPDTGTTVDMTLGYGVQLSYSAAVYDPRCALQRLLKSLPWMGLALTQAPDALLIESASRAARKQLEARAGGGGHVKLMESTGRVRAWSRCRRALGPRGFGGHPGLDLRQLVAPALGLQPGPRHLRRLVVLPGFDLGLHGRLHACPSSSLQVRSALFASGAR